MTSGLRQALSLALRSGFSQIPSSATTSTTLSASSTSGLGRRSYEHRDSEHTEKVGES